MNEATTSYGKEMKHKKIIKKQAMRKVRARQSYAAGFGHQIAR